MDQTCQKSKTNFQYVDLLKLFFAILIFTHHAGLNEGGVLASRIVVRLAVPFFFVASGFFFYRKLEGSPETESWLITRKSIKRLLLMLIIFEPISLLIEMVKWFINDKASIATVLLKSLKSIVFYPYGALWYVQATIVTFLLIFLLIKYKKMILVPILGIPLFCIGLLLNNYYFLISGTGIGNFADRCLDVIISGRNGLFFGFIFVGIGALICKHQEKLIKSTLIAGISFAVAMSLLIIEAILINDKDFRDDRTLLVSLLVAVPSLFVLAISINKSLFKSSTIFRNLSTSIYLLHPPITSVAYYSFKIIDSKVSLPIPIPLLTFAVASLLLFVIIFVIYKYKVKHLYNWIV